MLLFLLILFVVIVFVLTKIFHAGLKAAGMPDHVKTRLGPRY